MSLIACAEAVEKGDSARFAATMAAPPAARERLWPLYAANLEIARAPWAAKEPVVAEMRLQWWIDTIDGLAAGHNRRGHAVTEALALLLREVEGLAPLMTSLAEARRWDCWSEPFADRAAFDGYLDATSGNLMWAAALCLGAPEGAEGVVRDFAWGAGLAGWLKAAPELEARARLPFVDGRPEMLARLAKEGRDRIATARQNRAALPKGARAALWTGASADRLLALAAREPGRVAAGSLEVSDFHRRGALLWRALTGTF